jgi:hypothetical protein
MSLLSYSSVAGGAEENVRLVWHCFDVLEERRGDSGDFRNVLLD